MPSPIAHVAAGYVLYRVFRRRLSLVQPADLQYSRPTHWPAEPGLLVSAIALSMLPDVDSALGFAAGDLGRFHNQVTHSLVVGLGVALGVGGVVYLKGLGLAVVNRGWSGVGEEGRFGPPSPPKGGNGSSGLLSSEGSGRSTPRLQLVPSEKSRRPGPLSQIPPFGGSRGPGSRLQLAPSEESGQPGPRTQIPPFGGLGGPGPRTALYWSLFVLLCYSLHVVMDFFTAGRGVLALWPLSQARYLAPVTLFAGLHWSEGLWSVRHVGTALSELTLIVLMGVGWGLLRRDRSVVEPANDGAQRRSRLPR